MRSPIDIKHSEDKRSSAADINKGSDCSSDASYETADETSDVNAAVNVSLEVDREGLGCDFDIRSKNKKWAEVDIKKSSEFEAADADADADIDADVDDDIDDDVYVELYEVIRGQHTRSKPFSFM